MKGSMNAAMKRVLWLLVAVLSGVVTAPAGAQEQVRIFISVDLQGIGEMPVCITVARVCSAPIFSRMLTGLRCQVAQARSANTEVAVLSQPAKQAAYGLIITIIETEKW